VLSPYIRGSRALWPLGESLTGVSCTELATHRHDSNAYAGCRDGALNADSAALSCVSALTVC
jgi:hypothetical protein